VKIEVNFGCSTSVDPSTLMQRKTLIFIRYSALEILALKGKLLPCVSWLHTYGRHSNVSRVVGRYSASCFFIIGKNSNKIYIKWEIGMVIITTWSYEKKTQLDSHQEGKWT